METTRRPKLPSNPALHCPEISHYVPEWRVRQNIHTATTIETDLAWTELPHIEKKLRRQKRFSREEAEKQIKSWQTVPNAHVFEYRLRLVLKNG